MRPMIATTFVMLSALAAAPAAALPLEVQRVAPPAHLLEGSKKLALLPKRRLEEGDRLVTGRNGRVVLMLDGHGGLVLGDDSDLYLHSVEAAGEGYGALARLALMRGSLRLDATLRPDLPAQDMRLNVGTLRVRVLGAEVWANVEPGVSQTVCLLQGTVEILSDIGDETLDAPGDCFRYSASNVRMRLRPDSDATLQRKLARTAFAGETPPGAPPVGVAAPGPAPTKPPVPLEMPAAPEAPVALELPPPADPTALPPPEPVPVAESAPLTPTAVAAVIADPAAPPAAEAPVEPVAPIAAAEPAAAVAVAAPAGPEWTVVVASLKSAAAAQKESARLIAKGYAAQVSRTAKGFHRIYIGRFGSRELAQSYASDLRANEKLQTWVEPVSGKPGADSAPARAAVQPEPPAAEPVTAAAPVAAPAAAAEPVEPPAPATPDETPAAAASDKPSFTVVVASLKSEDAAQKEAARLAAQGLAAQACKSPTGNFRVCVGRYESRGQARAEVGKLLDSHQLKGWVASGPD